MSVATGNKGEKAKKFQSLNINNLYQGSALKPLQKSIPTKHGLQSLGKVPTARRAPANLPSLKAEHSGNDPSVNLVPSGHSASGGWTASGKEETGGEHSKTNNIKGLLNSGANEAAAPQLKKSSQSAPSAPDKNFQPSLSSKSTWGQASQQQQQQQQQSQQSQQQPQPAPNQSQLKHSSSGSFINQRSPLFGQDFPSLTGQGEGSAPNATSETGSPSPPPGSKVDAKYGPGPSLRPQSFPSWSFKQGHSSPNNHNDRDVPINSGEKGPSPPAATSFDSRNRNLPETGGLKFDVGVNSPLLQQGGSAPFLGRKQSSQRNQLHNKNASSSSSAPSTSTSGGGPRSRENLFQGTIIDSEKLKRMDDIDSNDDDWTRRDDSFDYNKRIDSDDEDDFSVMDRGGGQSNWTDQISFPSTNHRHSEPRDNFDAKPSVYSRSGSRGKAPSSSNQQHPQSLSHEPNHLSFLDEEDQRLSKKNEEVLKNIERARRRRAEEEQKYRINDDFGGDRRTPGLFSDVHARRSNERHSPGGLENGVTKSPSGNTAFGKFDVGGPSESDDYDSEKFDSHEMGSSSSNTNRSNSKPANSAPPRFKRHGVELHSYKRTSPPKERGQQYVGETGDNGMAELRSSTSRESAEMQPPEKDYVALFRQQPSAPPNSGSWGIRRQSGSSDQNEDLSLSSTSVDQHFGLPSAPNNVGEEEKKFSKETVEEEISSSSNGGNNLVRASGGRHSVKGNKGRGGEKNEESNNRHKASSKASEAKGKQPSSNKSERSSRGGQARQSNGPSKGHDKRLLVNDHKSSGSNARGPSHRVAPQKKDDEESVRLQGDEEEPSTGFMEASDHPSSVTDHENGGWFAPRGEPSRRGRGGLVNSGMTRANVRPAPNAHEKAENSRGNRKSQPRDADWDESSSDRSEEAKSKESKRRGGESRSHNRREKSKKQVGNKSQEADDKRQAADEDTEAPAGNGRHRRGGGNSARGDKDNSGRVRGDRPSDRDRDRERRERDNKNSYERRQSKLPPRLAKQKEQNRFTATQSISAQEAWGSAPTSNDAVRSSDSPQCPPVAWDLVSAQQQQQQFGGVLPSQQSLATGINDFEANRALLMQRFRNDDTLNADANSALRLDANLTVGGVVQAAGLTSNMDEAFTSESRENSVQTIIFENTNFKGGNRPLSGVSGAANSNGVAAAAAAAVAASESDKLIFKLGAPTASNEKSGLVGSFGAKAEDDLKLDFTFETADISAHVDDKSETAAKNASAHRTVPSSVSAPGVSTAQPATADDLNMKIASVKKVWETLPSMSPVPGSASGNDQNNIGPFASAEEKGFESTGTNRYADKEAPIKVRQQQPVSQAPTAAPPSSQQPPLSQATAAQVSHHLPPPSHGGPSPPQAQHNSPSMLHTSGQIHHATHQGLLQQASLDDRLLGRAAAAAAGNNANLAYNRLLGTGGLTNLQSPPSILGQQPSLYQAFQIDPNRGVTNQLYPYPPTAAGIGGQSLMLPPSGSGNSGSTTGDIFASNSNSQFGRQFAAPPPGSTQASSVMSSVLMSQPSLMSSAMKPSAASGATAIGPIGTKGAFQQGGLGSLAGSGTSPLLIPYDTGYVQNIQRSAAAAAGQTAFYQALAASSQQAAAAVASSSRHQPNTYGMTGFPAAQPSLVQQQLMRNQVPPQMANPYVKPTPASTNPADAKQLSGLQGRQYSTGGSNSSGGQQAIKATATSIASMSLQNSVLSTPTNGTAPAATSATSNNPRQHTTSYSPTPIQRPPGIKAKGAMSSEVSEDINVTSALEVASSKEKKLSDVED